MAALAAAAFFKLYGERLTVRAVNMAGLTCWRELAAWPMSIDAMIIRSGAPRQPAATLGNERSGADRLATVPLTAWWHVRRRYVDRRNRATP